MSWFEPLPSAEDKKNVEQGRTFHLVPYGENSKLRSGPLLACRALTFPSAYLTGALRLVLGTILRSGDSFGRQLPVVVP